VEKSCRFVRKRFLGCARNDTKNDYSNSFLKVYEGLTFAEIAAIVKASPNTVASRYRYGIEKLRVWFQEEDDNGN